MKKDKHVAPYFEGVFAADTLPLRLHKKPALLIANTDPITKPGSHWVAFYVGKNGEGEFFDSYGMPPIIPLHRQFLNRLCKKWTYNHTTLQAVDSQVCGEYCVLYLIHKAHGYSLHAFIQKLFCKDSKKNDDTVRKLFHRIFGHQRKCVLPSKTQKCCAKTR